MKRIHGSIIMMLTMLIQPSVLHAVTFSDLRARFQANFRLASDIPVVYEIEYLTTYDYNGTPQTREWLRSSGSTWYGVFSVIDDVLPIGADVRVVLRKENDRSFVSPVFHVPEDAEHANALLVYHQGRLTWYLIREKFDRTTFPKSAIAAFRHCKILGEDSRPCYKVIAQEDYTKYTMCDEETDTYGREYCRSVFLEEHPAFLDVPISHPAFQAIRLLRQQGLLKGYPDGTFHPDREISRADFFAILLRVFIMRSQNSEDVANVIPRWIYDESSKKPPPPFSDTPWDAWYTDKLYIGKAIGLIAGYPDGTFRPTQTINLAESGLMVAKIFDLPTQSRHSQRTWYQVSLDALRSRGALPLPVRSAEHRITRGEMAQIVAALLR